MRRIREALADDGVYLMMEPNTGSKLEDNLDARSAMLYGVSTLHCMTQSLAQGGAGLGAAWGRERAETMAGEAGFGSFQPLDDHLQQVLGVLSAHPIRGGRRQCLRRAFRSRPKSAGVTPPG